MTTATVQVATQWTTATMVGAVEVPEPEWNALARRGFHLHQWFRAAEDCGWMPRHVVVRQGDDARAIVPAYLTGAYTPHDIHERWMGSLGGLDRLGIAIRPVLSVQSPFSLTSDCLGDVNGLPRRVVAQVFDQLEARCAAERAKAVVWPFVDPGESALIAYARERGYAVLDAGVTARLPIWWESFKEYADSRSKSVRRTIRTDLAVLEEEGLETTGTSDFRDRAGEIDALYRIAYRARNGREPRVAPNLFSRLADFGDPRIVAQLAWCGGRLVGSSLNLAAGSVIDGTFSAFAVGVRGGPAYVNDLVYEPIRLACRLGIPAIDLGMSALYPKVLRGARLRRRVALVRGATPMLHRVLAGLGELVARRQAAKERRMLGPLWGPDCYERPEGAA
jgi:predicted N-acyltransferase